MSYSPTTPTEYDKSSLDEFGFFEHSIMHPEIASGSPDPICLDYPLGFELPSNRLPPSTSAAAVMPDDPTLSPNLATPDSEVGLSPRLNATAHRTGGRGGVCGPAHSANVNTPSPVMQHQHQNNSHSSSSPTQLRNGQHSPSHHFNQHPSIPDTQVSTPDWMQRASDSLLGRRGFTSRQSSGPTSTWTSWTSSEHGIQAMGEQWDSPSVLTGTNSGEGIGADNQQDQYKEQQDSHIHQIIDSIMHNHVSYADANSTSIQGHPHTYTLPQQPHQSSATAKHGPHTRSFSHSTTPPTPPLVEASPPIQYENDTTVTNVTGLFLGVAPYGLSQPAYDASGGRVHVQIPNHIGTAPIYGASQQTKLQALLAQRQALPSPLSLGLAGTTNRVNAGRLPGKPSQAASTHSSSATSPPSSRPSSFSSPGRTTDSATVGALGGPSPPFTGDGAMDSYGGYMPSSWSYEMPMPTQAYHDLDSVSLRPRSPTGPVAHISTSAHVSSVYQRYASAMLGGIEPSWASKKQPGPVVSGSTVTHTSPQPPPSTVNRDNDARASDTANVTARAGVIHRPSVTAARGVDAENVVSLPPSVVEPTVPLEVRVEGLSRDKRAMFERACGPRWNAVRDANNSTRTIEDVLTLENNRIVEAVYALLSSEALAKQMEIPDDLVEPLLARVPLPKTVAKRGSRGGAAGYTCLWAGCSKQLIKRLDHAKNHIREHCKSKPFACGGPTTQGAITGGRGCGQKFLRIDDLKRHQKSHCSVLKSGPARRPRAVRGVYHDEDDDEEHDSADSPFKGDDDDEYRPTEPRLYPHPTHAEPDAPSPAATNDQMHARKASTTRELVQRVRGEKQRAAAKQALVAVSAAAAYLVDEGSSDGGRSSPDTMTSGTRASPVDLGRLQTSHVRGGATSTLPAASSSSSAAMLAANSRLLSPTYSATQAATARDVHDGMRWDDLVEMDGGDMDVLGLDHQKVWLGCGALMASCSSRLISVRVRAATGCPHILSLLTSFIVVMMFGILCRVHDVMEMGWGRRVGGIPECRTRARLRGEDRAVRRDRM